MNRKCGLSKPTPTTLNGPAMKPVKTRRKVIEGTADTIRWQSSRQNLPRTASAAAGARRKRRYGKKSHRQNPPAYRQRGGGGRVEEKRTRGAHRREDKGNQSQNPPAGYHRGGGETKGENQHEMERWHNPWSREGGEVPSRKRIAERKQKTRITKKIKEDIMSCATVCLARLLWPPPGSELGRASAGRQKEKNKKNLQSRPPV